MTRSAIVRTSAVLLATVVLAGCATWTPEQRAAYEQQERQRSVECERRGGAYINGSCIARGAGQ